MTVLSIQSLRERIAKSGAGEDIVRHFALSMTGSEVSTKASDAEVLAAFSEGSVASEAIRTKLHPFRFPDFAVLGKYTGDNPAYHLVGGFGSGAIISEKAEKHGLPLDSAKNVLDFGCGTSRIIRYLSDYLPGPTYHASEVFEKNVEWGQESFPHVKYILQNNLPPLAAPDNFFDVIYAYSIFSHFDLPTHKAWLKEFHRILRPNGLVIFTVQSKVLLDRCKAEPELRQSLSMNESDLEAVMDRYTSEGFSFHRCYDAESLSAGGLDATIFGLAYVDPDFLKLSHPDFERLEHDEGAIARFQDWVVFRKIA